MFRFYSAKNCYFCTENIEYIDYKNVKILQRFLFPTGKINSRRKTGVCSKHQRILVKSIKRARLMALLPFVSK